MGSRVALSKCCSQPKHPRQCDVFTLTRQDVDDAWVAPDLEAPIAVTKCCIDFSERHGLPVWCEAQIGWRWAGPSAVSMRRGLHLSTSFLSLATGYVLYHIDRLCSISPLHNAHSRQACTFWYCVKISDPLTVTASVVGIVVPALQGARLLIDDLRKITDAPKVVQSLETDLASVSSSLESLQAIEAPQWQSLRSRIQDQSRAAVGTCVAACDAMRGDLQRWTRRSRDGKLSWRDKASIGFFKERRVKAMSEQLQSCKLTLNTVVGVATLYSTASRHVTLRLLTQTAATVPCEITR